MTIRFSMRRLSPVAIICAALLSGCQSSQGVGSQPVGQLSFAPAIDRDELRVPKRSSRERTEVRKSREDYVEEFRKRRAERLERFAALRASRDKDGKRRSGIRNDRMEDEMGTLFSYKRRDNKPWRSTKQIEGPQTANASGATPQGKYGALIAKYAKQHGVPYRLARAVVQVESSFRANVTGGAGEIGLMQIKLATARGMGYKGTRKQLYNPATNLYWGMKYLGKAHQLAGGNTCGTILRYNAGHYAKRMNRVSSRYCGKVRRILA